jgi:hypothetical protein
MIVLRSPILSSLNLTTVASSSAPTIGNIISTEAAHAFVSSAGDKSACPPKLFLK